MSSFYEFLIHLLLVTRGILPKILYRKGGIYLQDVPRSGFLGGEVMELKTEGNEIQCTEANVLQKYDCGHIARASEIGGQCEACGSITCNKPECLAFDPISAVRCCNRCYVLERGVPVSILTRETHLLWKREVRKYLKRTQQKQLPG